MLAAAPARAACLDVEAYARVLERHTAEVSSLAAVAVDYRALQGSADWKAVVASLDACRADAGDIAFWLNAYNILAIDLVLRHYPLESIRDIGSFWRPVWKHRAGRIGGRGYSLGEIEHEILRKQGEPRIHGALVCASLSCPPLRREPYDAARLDTQLDDSLRRWLADRRKGARIDLEDGTLWLSRVFKWFADDFDTRGGVLAFVRPYLPQDPGPAPRIRYLPYDWALNDLGGSAGTR